MSIQFWNEIFSSDDKFHITIRLNSLNIGSVPNTGYRPLYTNMSHFAAFAPLQTDEPLRGFWSHYTVMGRLAAHFRYLVHYRNSVNLPNNTNKSSIISDETNNNIINSNCYDNLAVSPTCNDSIRKMETIPWEQF